MSSSRQCCAVGGTYRRAANTCYLSSSLVFQYPANEYRMMSDTSSTSKSKCPSTGKYTYGCYEYHNILQISNSDYDILCAYPCIS